MGYLRLKGAITKIVVRHPGMADILKSVFSNTCLVNNAVYKKYILRKAADFDQISLDRIPGISIETTVNCNAKCIMCYHGTKDLSGIMDMNLFNKIIDECVENEIDGVGLSIYGEPLMDPLLFQRIEYLRKYDMKYSFFTNGSLLTEKKARQLFELGGLKKINFSVSGYDRETYEKVMVHLNREKVYKNILSFLELKNKLNQGDPIVAVSFVKTRLNYTDKHNFIRFWRKQRGVDEIIIADLWNRVGDSDIQKIV